MSLLLSLPNSLTHSHLVAFTTHLPSPSPLHCDRRFCSQRSQYGAHHLYGDDNGNGINPGRRRGCVVRAINEDAGPSSVVLHERLKTPAAACGFTIHIPHIFLMKFTILNLLANVWSWGFISWMNLRALKWKSISRWAKL